MSAALAYDEDVLELPEPIGLQPVWLNSSSARKVLRVGRRGSKTRFAMVAAIAGHGPGAPDDPLFGGILDGGDVLWVAVDYPQLTTVMWREELVPRFGNLSWTSLNAQQHNLEIEGKGTLFLRSAEALNGVRGMGKNLKGVIIDEAAHFDLESALLNEVLPTLLDNQGWLVIMSTTNAGPDGNSEKRLPSFFNVICEKIRARDPKFDGWEEFYGTAFDNPVINDDAIRELVGFYPDNSPQLKQEVYAELLKAGVGLALEQMDSTKHIIPRQDVPSHWTEFGAFDWGFNHPYVFGWFAADEDGNVLLIDSVTGRKEQPDQIAAKVEAAIPVTRLRYIVGGHDLKNDMKARGETGPTLKERFTARGWKIIDATISRVSGLNNLRLYTQWRATEQTPETTPRFQMFDTASNREVFATLARMQVDPDDLEDALKVDADANGKGGDDAYDMVRYGLMSRPMRAKSLGKATEAQDRSPRINFSRPGQPVKRENAEQEMNRLLGRNSRPGAVKAPRFHR